MASQSIDIGSISMANHSGPSLETHCAGVAAMYVYHCVPSISLLHYIH